MVFRISRFWGYNCTSKSPLLVDQSSPNVFRPTGRKCCRSYNFPISDISVSFGDICAQSGKGSEIGPKLACFSPPPIFFGGALNFWTGVMELNMLPSMTQNFAAIGQGTSEISR